MLRPVLACSVLFCLIVSSAQLLCQTQPAAGPSAAAPATPSSVKTAASALPDPKTPQEFFARARQLSDLEASGIPFHLKATYVASGDTEFTGNGTYEEWWQSKDLWRKEATLGDYKYVELQYGGKNSVYGSSDYVPLRLRQMLDAVLIRIAPDAGTASEWRLKREKLKNVDFIVLSSVNACTEVDPQVKCATQDHFTQSGILRIHAVDVVETLYNDFHLFQGMACPASVFVSASGKVILAISSTSLEMLSPKENVLLKSPTFPGNLQPIASPRHAQHGPGVTMPKLISPSPIRHDPYYYRPYARRVTPAVEVREIIDERGRVREPHVIHSGGPSSDKDALNFARSCTFEPLKIHGIPYSSEMVVCFSCGNGAVDSSVNAKKSRW